MNNYALIVGINHYTAPARQGLRELQGAVKDATSVHEWLVKNNKVKDDGDHCHLITSTSDPLKPVKNDIDTAIANIVRHVQEGGGDADRFYFYFAGHGLGVELDIENNALCMSNWSEYMRDAALSSKEYKRKFLSEGLFKEVVIWMDCCRNTKMYLSPGASSGLYKLGPNADPRWFLAAATQFENQAFEANTALNETRGVFTQVLLEGLNGAASEDGEKISADNLRDYLTYYVPLEAQKAGYTQKPDINHNAGKFNPLYF